MEYYSAIKREWICDNIDETWGYYAKWNNSDREGQIWFYSYAELKKNKQNKTKTTN